MRSVGRDGANRRKVRRLPANTEVSIRVTSGLLRRGRRLPATGFDFNRYGMGFYSRVPLREGTRLMLDIRGPNMVLRQVRAFVVTCLRTDTEYRIGVRFYRRLNEFNEPGPGHPLRFLQRLEESLDPDAEGKAQSGD